MNKEEFVKECVKEELIVYGTTWESNLKRLKELKQYKKMWEEFYKVYGARMVEIDNRFWFVESRMNVVKQRYFKPNKTMLNLEIESRDMEDSLKKIYGFINSANGGAVEGFYGHITLTGIKDVQES